MLETMKSRWVLVSCIYTVYFGVTASMPSGPPTMEQYEIYEELSTALTNDDFAMYAIRELFFPSVGASPVCAPIQFSLKCANSSQLFNSSFLWTQYDSQMFVGQLLLSSAFYGIVLDGFDWVDYCWFFEDENATQVLNLSIPSACDGLDSVLSSQLQAITALLKAFASGSVSGSSITSYKAYALPWDDTAGNNTNNIFHKSHIILSIVVAMLNIFIFSFSLGICSNLYDAIYSEIKCKKNPYYPLFWSVVFLSMLWNIGPSWLVLSLDSPHIRYSLVAMIPVQFILALFTKKYPEFPIPGMQWWSLPQKLWKRLLSELGEVDMDTPPPQKNFFWEVCKLKSPARAIVSFVFQTIAIWSLLVLFMFVVYYGLTVAISLYLYPIQTLVKILFIKAIAICAVFDVALLFSGQSLDYHCSRKAWLVNITLLSQTLAVFSFIPVLAFLAYTIGGVLFSAPASQLNGVQGIIALLPSAFLVLVGWYSRGTLFPEKFPHDEAGHGSVQQNTNGYQPPIDHSDSSQHHSSGHTTAIKLEQEIKELTNRESGSSGPHTSEQTPLLPDKKS